MMLTFLLAVTMVLPDRPIIIGHRGASALRPEHTLEAYRVALDIGADFIEPDLVITKDGVLIARHENEISGTTDVASKPEFADRKRSKTIDGVPTTGWFSEDFTFAEIKTLRAKERLPQIRKDNTRFDGQFQVPSFDEVLAFARSEEKKRGRPVGVYPETKHPSYFQKVGLPLEPPLLKVLAKHGYGKKSDWIYIQSFEVGNLKWLRSRTKLSLIQLIDSGESPADQPGLTTKELVSEPGLAAIAKYADGVGVAKVLAVDVTGKATSLIANAHKVGLKVHAWTFRDEDFFLAPDLRGRPLVEYDRFFAAGIDGVFADQPGTAVRAWASFRR
ncbi:MAG: glycerophosphodiester phosphodiesterase [Fimbriimonas sp.]